MFGVLILVLIGLIVGIPPAIIVVHWNDILRYRAGYTCTKCKYQEDNMCFQSLGIEPIPIFIKSCPYWRNSKETSVDRLSKIGLL